ncbi:MAG: hypothetical protein ACXWLL_11090 [Myxococcaceae bacterium]
MKPSKFQNVDLDLSFAHDDVAPLLEAFARILQTMHREAAWASFELEFPDPKSADEAIARYAEHVRRLRPEARAAWSRCTRRTMNIGVEGPSDRTALTFAVSRTSLELLDEIGADLVFTVYRPEA